MQQAFSLSTIAPVNVAYSSANKLQTARYVRSFPVETTPPQIYNDTSYAGDCKQMSSADSNMDFSTNGDTLMKTTQLDYNEERSFFRVGDLKRHDNGGKCDLCRCRNFVIDSPRGCTTTFYEKQLEWCTCSHPADNHKTRGQQVQLHSVKTEAGDYYAQLTSTREVYSGVQPQPHYLATLPGTPVIPSALPFTIQPAAPASTHSRGFNPYSLYPNSKLIFKIEGDLKKMAGDWSRDEMDTKRRLVKVDRIRSEHTIEIAFSSVSPDQLPQKSICVSCIWWEKKDEYYITSVDIVSLLESLVAVRFTTEEKSRIRRKLEAFKPLTLHKPESKMFFEAESNEFLEKAEFFEVIMGLPKPKPYTVRKDVKVFHWKSLAAVLEKFSKTFSLSRLSAAGALDSGHNPSRDQPRRRQLEVPGSKARLAGIPSLPPVPEHLILQSAPAPKKIRRDEIRS